MRYRQHCWLVMTVVLIARMVGASTALADPYQWTPAQIQGLADVTPGFHGGAGQLSTINSITPIADGVELDVTFRIGQEADPFGADYGLGFARVSLSGGLGAGLDISSFTSSSLKITTTTNITAQSFLQTDFTEDGTTIDDGDANPGEAFSFLFWEHSDDIGAGGPMDVDFDFLAGNEFSTADPVTDPGGWDGLNPQAVQGTGGTRAWGLQLAKFSDMVIGQPVNATVTLQGVPEPTAAVLAGIAAIGCVGIARRRN